MFWPLAYLMKVNPEKRFVRKLIYCLMLKIANEGWIAVFLAFIPYPFFFKILEEFAFSKCCVDAVKRFPVLEVYALFFSVCGIRVGKIVIYLPFYLMKIV